MIPISIENDFFTICQGTRGRWKLTDVDTVSVLNEHAAFKGESIPFSHQVFARRSKVKSLRFFEPKLYVGLKIRLKNKKVLAAYVSENPVVIQTNEYQNDRNTAENYAEMLASYGGHIQEWTDLNNIS